MSKKLEIQPTEFKFTRAKLTNLPYPKRGMCIYKDLVAPGLKLRVGKKTKVFYFEGRIKDPSGSKSSQSAVKVTIGKLEAWDIESARKEVRKHLRACDLGLDPRKQEEDEQKSVALALVKDAPVTMREAFEIVFSKEEIKKGTIKAATVEAYRYDLNRHFPDWMDRPFTDITHPMLLKRHGQVLKISACEAKRTFARLSSLWNRAYTHYAVIEGRDFPASPITALKLTRLAIDREQAVVPKVHLGPLIQSLFQWYSLDSLTAIQRNQVLCFILGLFTGYRGEECRMLKWDHVSFTAGTITLPGSSVKNGRRHLKPIGPCVMMMLKDLKASRSPNDVYVFPGSRSRSDSYMSPQSRILAKIIQDCGIPFAPHALRRTFSSLAEQIGVPRTVLQKFLNHTGDVTDGYVKEKFDPETNRAWMIKIEREMLKLAKIKVKKLA